MKSKVRRLNNISMYIMAISMIFLFAIIMIFSTNYVAISSADNNGETIADGFVIDNYQIKMEIGKNNIAKVEETIGVNFTEEGHHGIYRIIPQWLKYTNKEGQTKSRFNKVSNLHAIDEKYYVENIVNGKKKITMRDGDKLVPKGPHYYKINYEYNMGKDPYKGYDEFIFHAFGDYWGTEIKNASLEIIFPENIEEKNIKFYSDKYKNVDITSNVNYYAINRTLHAKVKDNYQLMKSLTVDVELEDNYFNEAISSYNNSGLIVYFLGIFLSFLIFFIWLKKGKDLKKTTNNTVNGLPKDLDPAEIGYIYKKDTGKRLITSLLLSLSTKEYINIKNEDSKTIVEKNTSDKEKEAMSENERLLFEHLFNSENDNSIILSEDKSIFTVIYKINQNISNKLDDKINDIVSSRLKLFTSILLIIELVLLMINQFNFEIDPKYTIIFLLSYLSCGISLIFIILMNRKNEYGESLKQQIDGFKNYVENTDKEYIKNQLNRDDSVFYYLLPYVYVLGISKNWSSKFKKEELSNYSIGNINYYDTSYIDSISDSISSSSSGSSSCGGGGCGGGCSSCGGGGSC